jgi:single-strand DNA-binding protein
MGGDAGGGMGMDEGGYDAPPSRPAPRQAPPAPAARPQPQRPAPNFSDMDDDIPF